LTDFMLAGVRLVNAGAGGRDHADACRPDRSGVFRQARDGRGRAYDGAAALDAIRATVYDVIVRYRDLPVVH